MTDATRPVGDRGQDVLAIGLAPFIAVGRTAQVMLLVIDRLGAVPVVVAHALAVMEAVSGALVSGPARVLLHRRALAHVAVVVLGERQRRRGQGHGRRHDE